MTRKLWAALGVVAMVGVLAGAAVAQFAKTEDAVKYRQSAMFLIGQHFSRMGAVVKGDAPYDKAAFEKNAAAVDTLYRLPVVEAFMVAGSDKGSGMKPEALSEKDKFTQMHNVTSAELAKLVAAARGGDLNAIKPQFGATGGTCQACHKAYRK
ncbi:MAG: cytochrome c [Desulfobacterales bacterium]|jgi:cytochrome c556|nr:cytochrome c [Desulfobacterales bacterium]